MLGFISFGVGADDLLGVYQKAIDNDAQLAASKAGLDSNREVVPQALAGLLPNVVLNANTSRENLDSETYSSISPLGADIKESYSVSGYQVMLTQPIFNAERWYNYESSKDIEKNAEIQYELTKQQLIIRVADAYFNALRAEDNLSLAEAEESAYHRQLEQVRKNYKSGLIAETDTYEAQAVYDTAKVNRIIAENNKKVALEALSIITGGPVKSIENLSDQMPILPIVPDSPKAWLIKAENNNKNLIIFKNFLEIADKELTRRKTEHLPIVNFSAAYSDTSNKGVDIYGNDYTLSSVRLDVTIPLYLGGSTSSRVRQSFHQKQQAAKNFEYHKRFINQNITNLFRLVQTSILRVDASSNAVESNKLALEATKKGYRVGSRNLIEVLQAQRALFAAEKDYANARYDYILSKLNLKMEAGVLDEGDLKKFNKYLKKSKVQVK